MISHCLSYHDIFLDAVINGKFQWQSSFKEQFLTVRYLGFFYAFPKWVGTRFSANNMYSGQRPPGRRPLTLCGPDVRLVSRGRRNCDLDLFVKNINADCSYYWCLRAKIAITIVERTWWVFSTVHHQMQH